MDWKLTCFGMYKNYALWMRQIAQTGSSNRLDLVIVAHKGYEFYLTELSKNVIEGA